jgi:hypothetical protein
LQGNGAIRDFTYAKRMDDLAAHQLSTVSCILFLGIVTLGFVRLCRPASGRQAISICLLWLALTVAFEFLFFHFVGGHPWSELLDNYDELNGRI